MLQLILQFSLKTRAFPRRLSLNIPFIAMKYERNRYIKFCSGFLGTEMLECKKSTDFEHQTELLCHNFFLVSLHKNQRKNYAL